MLISTIFTRIRFSKSRRPELQLIYTDDNFVVSGMTYPRVPILLDGDFEIVKPFFQFIVYLTVQDGRIQSNRTVKNYANALYDYFSFLDANQLLWDDPYLNKENSFTISVLALYRNWSKSLLNDEGHRIVSDSSINMRLSVLKRFYEYCYKASLINFEPWEVLFKLKPERMPGFLRHTHGQKVIKSNDLMIKTFKRLPKLLSLDQCRELIGVIDNLTMRLITKLILSTGIRKDEVISFSRRYIFEPDMQKPNIRIPISLEPTSNGQRTKGSKARTIYLSAPLMKELWDYLHFGEGVIRTRCHKKSHGKDPYNLFLNRFGEPFSEAALNNFYRTLYVGESKRLSFSVNPHMLRHTYATIELYAESTRTNTTKALAWVKARLGHSSISTTAIYLHCIETLYDQELSSYQAEIDAME